MDSSAAVQKTVCGLKVLNFEAFIYDSGSQPLKTNREIHTFKLFDTMFFKLPSFRRSFKFVFLMQSVKPTKIKLRTTDLRHCFLSTKNQSTLYSRAGVLNDVSMLNEVQFTTENIN